MGYTTFIYLVFLALVFLLYHLMPLKLRWWVLLAGNLVFYSMAGLDKLAILFVSALWTYGIGLALDGTQEEMKALKGTELEKTVLKEKKKALAKKKGRILHLGIGVLLLVLGFTKYTNYVLRLVAGNLLHSQAPVVRLVIPLGISFYTFMMIAYLMDISKGKERAERNFARYFLFASFFPTVVQGPICRFKELRGQLYEGHRFSLTDLQDGALWILWGFAKKLVIAERLGAFVDPVFDSYKQHHGLIFLVAACVYSIQIYADFSGCMDIGLGTARLFGIELPRNFLRPCFSLTLPEFWRRWHASLGSFFKDYVFFPFSISKMNTMINKKARKTFGENIGKALSVMLPIYVVWALTGIWHGAQTNYVVWGLYHGTLIVLSTLFSPLLASLGEKLHIRTGAFSYRLFQMLRTFLLCSVGRIFFRASGVRVALSIFKRMLKLGRVSDAAIFQVTSYPQEAVWGVVVVLLLLGAWLTISILQEQGKDVLAAFREQNLLFRWALLYLLFFTVLLAGKYGTGYEAASFIYEQF